MEDATKRELMRKDDLLNTMMRDIRVEQSGIIGRGVQVRTEPRSVQDLINDAICIAVKATEVKRSAQKVSAMPVASNQNTPIVIPSTKNRTKIIPSTKDRTKVIPSTPVKSNKEAPIVISDDEDESKKKRPIVIPLLSLSSDDDEGDKNKQTKKFHSNRELLKCLDGTQRLNDEVINDYLTVLSETYEIKCFSTFLMEKLHRDGIEKTLDIVWFTEKSIYNFKKLFFPIFLSNMRHWLLGVAYTKSRVIKIYDSLSMNAANAYCEKLTDLLTTYDRNNTRMKPKGPDWTYTREKDVPQQKNTNDCGVFMLKFAFDLATNDADDVKLTEFDVAEQRQHIKDILRDVISNKVL